MFHEAIWGGETMSAKQSEGMMSKEDKKGSDSKGSDSKNK